MCECIPSRQGKTFRAPPPFKEWKLPPPPFNMGKTSRYSLKTTPKLVVPPSFSMAKTFSAPHLFVGVKLHMPLPSRFVAPPPPFPIISDQSLIRIRILDFKYILICNSCVPLCIHMNGTNK